MAISRSQQPRQMYGLGSFVKKITRKVTKPVTKVASKLVPKEIAGIMRTAAPFLPPGYREAAYLLGTAKQTGRISPVDLALVSAPYINKALGSQKSLPLMERKGLFAEKLPGANEFLFGAPETTLAEASLTRTPTTVGETTGIFGSGGKMFQFGGEQGVMDQIKGFRDQTKLGDLLLGGKEPGTFSKSKVAGFGIGTLSLIQNSKTPEEAGTALAEATGNPDDYESGYALFSQLPQGIFDIPEEYRLPAQAGGLMRENYAMGSGMKMAEFDMQDYMQEFERVFPEMKEKRGSDEYNEMLKDYFRGLASKDKEGIMMAGGFNDKYMSPEYAEELKKFMMKEQEQNKELMLDDLMERFKQNMRRKDPVLEAKDGGRANLALGTRPTDQESGLGGLPIEADMRYTGGFMPYGEKEKADDVPARLSKNEFVFTADAVRAAGGGSVNEGAKKMYQAMKQLEKKPEAKGMMA